MTIYIYRYDYNIYMIIIYIWLYIHETHIYIYDYICTSPYLHVYSEIKATNSKRLEATQKGYCPASTPAFSGWPSPRGQVTRWYWNEVLQLAADTHTISYFVLNPAKPFVFVESTYVLAKQINIKILGASTKMYQDLQCFPRCVTSLASSYQKRKMCLDPGTWKKSGKA